MKNIIVFSLYSNSRSAVIGNIQKGGKRLLATTRPATIAASIFAMAESVVVFRSDKEEAEFAFPIQAADVPSLTAHFENHDDGSFIAGLVTFSHMDFLHLRRLITRQQFIIASQCIISDSIWQKQPPCRQNPKGFQGS